MIKIIGVQTFWDSNSNYGQILQGFALQNFLKCNGYKTYIIKYCSILSRIKGKIKLILNGYYIYNYPYIKKLKFSNFKRTNIEFSNKKYHTLNQLKRHPPIADIYITGSDQVWTYMHNTERRKAYLLSFGTNRTKKIAYAASFGRDTLNSDEIKTFQKSLNSFDFIGVREYTGSVICKKLGYNSSWVVDPVLLLPASYWKKMINKVYFKSNKKKNVFIYLLTKDNYSSIMKELDNEYNIYYINPSNLRNSNIYPTINEWLSYIYFSDYIITDSFHCTVFSVIFKKKFVTIERKGGETMNNRIISFLDKIKLSNRYCENNYNTINKVMNQTIDYQQIETIMDSWINYSITQFLKALK